MRTPVLLKEVANQHFDEITPSVIKQRPLLRLLSANIEDIETALHEEKEKERKRDKEYWQPLKQELDGCGVNALQNSAS